MDWEDLHVFTVFVQQGTLLRAAHELGLRHTTVARRIRNLETALGVPLVDRRGRKLQLLPAAREITQELGEIENRLTLLQKRVTGGKEGLSGRVIVSTTNILAQAVIAPALPAFLKTHPQLHLEIEVEDQITSLARKKADIAVRLGTAGDVNLVGRTVAHYGFAVYASHAFARKAAVKTRDDLRRLPYLRLTPPWSALPQEQWVEKTFGELPALLRATQSLTLMAALEQSEAVAVLPCVIADPNPRLARVFESATLPTIPVRVLAHKYWKAIPRVEASLRFLSDAIAARHKLLRG